MDKEIHQKTSIPLKQIDILSALVYLAILGGLGFLMFGTVVFGSGGGLLRLSYLHRLPTRYRVLEVFVDFIVFVTVFATLANLKRLNVFLDSPSFKRKSIAVFIAIFYILAIFLIYQFGISRTYQAVSCYGMYIEESCYKLNNFGK